MVPVDGSTMGRFDSEKAHIGARTKASRSGARMGPPAAAAYAVEPVGVATMTPSALYEPNVIPLKVIDKSTIRAIPLPEITASLSASAENNGEPLRSTRA